MKEWQRGKFWSEARVVGVGGGYGVTLDAKLIKTPAGRTMILPALGLAERVKAEWDTQEDCINYAGMQFTRMSNSAIDRIRPARVEVVRELLAYFDTDLICYQAMEPDALVRRQQSHWEPVRSWIQERLGIKLCVTAGILPVSQPEHSRRILQQAVSVFDEFELSGFSELVGLSGSLLLALACAYGYDSRESVWRLSRLDEDWQREHWGIDEEEANATEGLRNQFVVAAEFLELTIRHKFDSPA